MSDNVRKSTPDLKKFLAIAIDIEKSLFESSFLKVFKLSGPKALKIQSQLIEATRKHIDRLVQWHTDEKSTVKPGNEKMSVY